MSTDFALQLGVRPGPQAVTSVWRTELGTTLPLGFKQHHCGLGLLPRLCSISLHENVRPRQVPLGYGHAQRAISFLWPRLGKGSRLGKWVGPG
jgi:hypothetical protein